MFDAQPEVCKAVSITRRSPQSWGYFGINSAALVAEPGPLMLGSEVCRVAFHFVVWRLKP